VFRHSVTGPSGKRPTLDPGLVRVGFVVDTVALAQVSVSALQLLPVSVIPPVSIRILTFASSFITVRAYALTIFPTDSFAKLASLCLHKRA